MQAGSDLAVIWKEEGCVSVLVCARGAKRGGKEERRGKVGKKRREGRGRACVRGR